MRVHLCCGDIYLKDYVNIDIKGKLASSLKENPNLTTLDKYYADREIGCARDIILDCEMDVRNLGLGQGELDEVLMISAFEHFTYEEAKNICRAVYASLKSGGKFRFDFPDIVNTAKYFSNEKMIRLIYGSYKNEYARHKWGYTKKTIIELLNRIGFIDIRFGQIVKHEYPMIGVTAVK